jgi:hypothetical protein
MRTVEDRFPTFQKTVVVIGGILRLEPQYRRVLKENNFIPRIYNRDSPGLKGKVEGTDFIILFTGTVSHKLARKVRKVASVCKIPLIEARPSSLSSLRRTICKHFLESLRKCHK